MENHHEPFVHSGVTISPEQQKLVLVEWNSRNVDHPDGPPSLNELKKIALPDSKNISG